MESAVSVEKVSKKYRLYKDKWAPLKELLTSDKLHDEFFALNDISLDFPKGEAIGVLGRNGSGKSTLLKIITGITEPTSGTVKVNGSIVFLDVSAGIDSELTGFENIFLKGILLGYTKEEMSEKIDEIISFSELGEFIFQPVKNYSSGMKSKLGFAISVNVDPDILIVDEALAVGDAQFREKCMNKMNDFKEQGKTIIFVSHDKNAVESFCSKAAWIERGELIGYGDSKYIASLYNDFMNNNKTFASIKAELGFSHSLQKITCSTATDTIELKISGYLSKRQTFLQGFTFVVRNNRTKEEIAIPVKANDENQTSLDFDLAINSEWGNNFFVPGTFSFWARYISDSGEEGEFQFWAEDAVIETNLNTESSFNYNFKKSKNLLLVIENKEKIQQQTHRIYFSQNKLVIEGVLFVNGYETIKSDDVTAKLIVQNKRDFKKEFIPVDMLKTDKVTENSKFNPLRKRYDFSEFRTEIDILDLKKGTYECYLEYAMNNSPHYKFINLVWASKKENYPSDSYVWEGNSTRINTESKYLNIEVDSV